MKTPTFWSSRLDIRSLLLWPVGFVYGLVTAWRMRRPGTRAALPVICIGNLTAGGTGKTPTVQWLAGRLRAAGERPFVVSRGYGGSLQGPVQVDPATMSAQDCGDEPLLLARTADVIVARDRLSGAGLARERGASVVILDDGLQNPGLAKDITIAVVDAEAGFGNGYCVPAGPLRAPVRDQLAKVDAFLAMGGIVDTDAMEMLRQFGKPVIPGKLAPDEADLVALKGKPLLAFAGIGRPQRFFATLRQAGLDVRESAAFADHHPFTQSETAGLQQRAAASGLTLVTTEKDAMRLDAMAPPPATLPVKLALTDDLLFAIVTEAIARRRLVP